MIQLNTVFASSVGIIQAPQFLSATKRASNEAIEQVLQKFTVDPIYPVIQTENMVWDPNLREFNEFILQKSQEYLDQQGYDTTKVRLSINDLWCQKHMKTSGHERHTHNNGAVLSAFYIIECPNNSSHLMLYDPRVGKDYGFVLPEKDERVMSEASSIVNYGPSEGELILANAYIPHGFSRNVSDKPFVMLHINVYAEWVRQKLDTKMNAPTGAIVI